MSAFDPKRTLSLNLDPLAVRQNALASGRRDAAAQKEGPTPFDDFNQTL